MAEGWLRQLAPDGYEAQSAGTERRAVHPLAIQAMAEVGIDISPHTSKLPVGLMQGPWDYVITVCDSANERCPLSSQERSNAFHWGFPDPSVATGTEEEKLSVFRGIRDQIGSRLKGWLADQQKR
jgi:arsenate reductase